jgi:hypothetical protein
MNMIATGSIEIVNMEIKMRTDKVFRIFSLLFIALSPAPPGGSRVNSTG